MRNNCVPAGHESYLARSTALLLGALVGIASLLVSQPVVAAPPALPQEYRTLAGHLAMPLKTSPDEFEGPGNLTETLSSGHTTMLSLKDIKSSDRQIEYITRQTEASLAKCLQRVERLNALPKPPGTGELMANSFIDGFMGNPGGGYSRGLEAEQMQTAIKNELYPLFAAMEKLDATHQMLEPVAKKYAANLTYPANRITVDLDESWGPVGPFDWLYVHNQGPAIRDATIVVKLTGADGATRTNVHFVRNWDTNTWLYGRYETGLQALGKSVGNTTVPGVKKVEVTVYSPRFSTAVSFSYEGDARDHDIAKYCKSLTFTGRYQPYVTKRYWPDTKRGVEFTLDGLEGIPRCQVKVTFWKGLLQKTETWEFDYWKRGDKKMFRPKQPLESDPTMATMEISFPGTSYQHRYSYYVTP
ncbi:hypothetical protein [Bremerella sp. P1]|uniref:hypothetical protein n=1 Tax=Bremerella sp. P1 TaxID=3026424 RepID=UPI0023685D86|nr:hypothetical protein [Bremerella sp. P1]WDI41020.1 hypothetical protein PSR63_21360 [Bremerella sp. P1]